MKKSWKAMDLAVMGLLVALNIIASKYLKIEIGTMIRINFSSSFIMLSGIWLGPIAGGLVGLVSDLLGCLIGGYSINILYTLMPVMIGVTCGFCEPIFRKAKNMSVIGVLIYGILIFLITLVMSVFYGTWALSTYYGYPFMLNFWPRLGQGVLSTVMNTAVVYLLYRSHVTKIIQGQTSRPQKIN